MTVLAIISARGNSKEIPNKNIRDLNGKPLIAWTIQAANNSKGISRVVVSTDSKKIAEVALSYGAEVPFMRPGELAQDNSSGISVVLHAIKWLSENENYKPLYIMLLQPTSPLRNSLDIDNAINLLENHSPSSVISVSLVKQHPYWMKNINKSGTISDFYSGEKILNTRQELPKIYIPNGAIYLTRSDRLLVEETWYDNKSIAYIMPEDRSLDIDTEIDLLIANHLTKNKKK